MQPNIDISDVLRRSFDLYKENITTLLIATFLAFVISLLSVGILAGPMFAGLVLITLGLIDKKQPKPDVGDLFKGFNHFLPALVYVILVFVASFLGQIILGFIPILGIFLPTLFSLALGTVTLFALFYIVEKQMDVVAALQKSYEVVKTNFWIFFAIYIVASVISMLGMIACFIGVFFTAPMYYCMVSVLYRDLHPAPASA